MNNLKIGAIFILKDGSKKIVMQEIDTYPRVVYKIYEISNNSSLRERENENKMQWIVSPSRILIDLAVDTNEMFNHDFETLQDALQYIKDKKEELQYKELTVLPVINAR